MTVIYILSTTPQPAFGSKRRSKLDDDHEQEADFIDVLLVEMKIDPTMDHIKALIVVLLKSFYFYLFLRNYSKAPVISPGGGGTTCPSRNYAFLPVSDILNFNVHGCRAYLVVPTLV